jgi:hypothetical protein
MEWIAEHDRNESTRLFALHTLVLARSDASKSSLQRIAGDDDSRGIRLEANVELLRRGCGRVLQTLFDEYRRSRSVLNVFPEVRRIIEDNGMPLSRHEERKLDQLAAKAIVHHREQLRTANDETERAVSAMFLSKHSSKRYPVRAVEVDAMGRLALNATRTKTSVIAVNALGLLESPRADQWLRAVFRTSRADEATRRARQFLGRSNSRSARSASRTAGKTI